MKSPNSHGPSGSTLAVRACHGFLPPIVIDTTGQVHAGLDTLRTAEKLGLSVVPVIRIDRDELSRFIRREAL